MQPRSLRRGDAWLPRATSSSREAVITPINLPSVTTAANGERSQAMTAATSMMVSPALTDASWAAVPRQYLRDRLAAQFLGYRSALSSPITPASAGSS